MERKLKVLDLFAGIGGFALGLDSTNFFKTVKFVEKDKYCQKVLRKNFPNIPIEEDVKDVKGKRYEADVIVGGFPCQPMSVAGKRKGTDDDRYLWPEMFRLIREIKPEFVIGENVQGIINIQNGMVLRQVQDDLEGEGFEVQCFLIPASGIGAWHQRYRVWIVGHSNENGLLREVHKAEIVSNANTRLSIGKNKEIQARRDSITCSSEDVPNTNHTRGRASKHGIEREGKKVDEGWKRQPQPESSRHDENVSNTTSKRLEREFGKKLQRARVRSTNSSEDVSNTNKSLRGGGRTISLGRENKVWRFRVEEEGIRDNVWIETVGRNAVYREGETDVSQSNNERQQEFNISKESRKKNISDWGYDTDETKQTWWQIESDLCGVPNGISYELDKDRANRIKTLGNAIVPQIAREFGLAIKKVLVDEDII
jgi:DNA (cytosine-5)-methyltransferase 1